MLVIVSLAVPRACYYMFMYYGVDKLVKKVENLEKNAKVYGGERVGCTVKCTTCKQYFFHFRNSAACPSVSDRD